MSDSKAVVILETPRDAFQGLPRLIPLTEKLRYIQCLIDAGFRHIDVGSFVSPRAVPQMADSDEVVLALRKNTKVEKTAIVVNEQGLVRALAVGGLDSIGFPFSLSSQFQVQNTKTTTTQTWPLVEKLISNVEKHDMSFVLYLSMAFGNPYGEAWNEDALFSVVRGLCAMGVRHISLADTVAVALPKQVAHVFQRARQEQPKMEFSAHFHGRPETWFANVEAALEQGCRRFDAASGGLGGCPFAQDLLVANIPSDQLAIRLEALGYSTGVNMDKVGKCAALAREFQATYGKE